MSLLLAAAFAAATAVRPACSWDRPGANPFVGDVVEAVDHYTDIPAAVRAALKTRMAARQYDEIATIGRNSISGRQRYAPEIRDMHFGQGEICRTVTRKKWPAKAVERGLVYCESGHCVIVPTVCRNLSRIKRLPSAGVASEAATASPPLQADAGTAPAARGDGELLFDAPGAGDSFAQRASPDAAAPPTLMPGGLGAAAEPAGAPAGAAGPGSAGTPAGAPPPVANGDPGTAAGDIPAGGDGGLVPSALAPSRPGVGPFDTGITPQAAPPLPVPEPGTWALMSAGGLVLLAALRRRR